MAIIFFISSLSAPPGAGGATGVAGHLAGYFVLAVLAIRAFAGRLSAAIGVAIAVRALALTIGYGVTDEIHQRFVPGRFSDPADVAVDAIGACLGVGACSAWGIISRRSALRGTSRHEF